MTYDDEITVRMVRCVVNDGTSVFCPPLKREVLRRLVHLTDAQEIELVTLRQALAEQRSAWQNPPPTAN